MLKIGDFSKLSQISVRMLRYFDDKDLLKPIKKDELTQYRYYNISQLVLANTIVSLQTLGFSLQEISEILKSQDDLEILTRLFESQRQNLLEQYKESVKKINLIENSLKNIRKGEYEMDYSVIVKDIPQQNVISLRRILACYQDEAILWKELMIVVESKNIPYSDLSLATSIFHDKEYKESEVDVEIQLVLEGENTYENTGDVVFKTNPKKTVASVTFNGPYQQMTLVNKAIYEHISSGKEYEFCGPMFNIYHVGPAFENNPDKWVTEACFPIKEISK